MLVSATAAAERTITITGSSTLAPVVAEIAKRYEAAHANVRIDVHTGGSSRGIADVRAGRAQIGMVSRSLAADEADLVPHPVARDGIACIVHDANRVDGLLRQQVIDIFAGRMTSWSDASGTGGAIVVVSKAEGRATLELFCAHFGLRPAEIAAQVIIGDNAQGLKTVAGNRAAIGYVSIGAAEAESEAGVPIRLLGLGGMAPTTAAVRDGTWPIARDLLLVTKGEPAGEAADFIAFARSPAVDDLIAEQFLVPPRR
ncbi:MAG: phosphate ABC transporter substrate-binding protein [Nannocystis sp.]|nr:phosphate ABC transporter substrate-binding protein [Nannocystis sp.]